MWEFDPVSGKYVSVNNAPSTDFMLSDSAKVAKGLGMNYQGEAPITNYGNTDFLATQQRDAGLGTAITGNEGVYGTIGDYDTATEQITTPKTQDTQPTNPYVDAQGNMTSYGMMQSGIGLGQLGLGVAGYLDNRKTAKKQREVMDQQIAANRFALGQAQGRQKDISRDFGLGK